MDRTTEYLGLKLVSPLVVGAGPFDSVAGACKCAAAGAGMLVMHSLFEEQFSADRAAQCWAMEHGAGPDEYEALEADPTEARIFGQRPEEYFAHLATLKKAVSIPVSGSINGITPGNWVVYAQEMESAGADAIELNLYDPIMDTEVSGSAIEERTLQVVKLVRRAVRVPLAVKLTPYYSSVAHLAKQCDNLGVDGIVLFNRFYQPDFDISGEPTLSNTLRLSTSAELPQRLRWTGALYGRVGASLAVAGGVHKGTDVIKAVLAGADVVQVVSVLMRHGVGRLEGIAREMSDWLAKHDVESLAAIRGVMSSRKVLDPEHNVRMNYIDMLREATAARADETK